jgi:hypothetical protein
MEIVGPNGLVVTLDGLFIIGDVYGNRLLRYDATGARLDAIDLTRLDILNISDLVGAGNDLYILEISFQTLPERYRVNHLTSEGKLVSQYDLPKGFHLEDGLYGLAIGYSAEGSAQVLIELRPSDSRYYRVPDSAKGLPQALPGLPVYGRDLRQLSAGPDELAMIGIGEQEFESQMTAGGMIFLLSAKQDGSLYLQREDLVAWDPAITTDLTIHYISPIGESLGVARYPLRDWYFHLWRFLAVGPDGNVYALITREKTVDILRLNFYGSLDPLIPGATEPVVTRVMPNTTSESGCTLVQRLSPDSPEAQQIVDEFIANYKQDFPTEYMAIEQLWAVDKLREYAAILGRVTQEENDIIIVRQTRRGYIMAARYHTQMILPGLRYSEIPKYFAAKLPEAPAALFYCLDLSRYVSEGTP